MAFVALEGWREIEIYFLGGSIRKSGSLSSLFIPAQSGLGDLLMSVGSLLGLVQQAAGVSAVSLLGGGTSPSLVSGWKSGSRGLYLERAVSKVISPS